MTQTKAVSTDLANNETITDSAVIDAPIIDSLETLVATMCFCKLKRFCPDKNSSECMKHRNIYQEFMASR